MQSEYSQHVYSTFFFFLLKLRPRIRRYRRLHRRRRGCRASCYSRKKKANNTQSNQFNSAFFATAAAATFRHPLATPLHLCPLKEGSLFAANSRGPLSLAYVFPVRSVSVPTYLDRPCLVSTHLLPLWAQKQHFVAKKRERLSGVNLASRDHVIYQAQFQCTLAQKNLTNIMQG